MIFPENFSLYWNNLAFLRSTFSKYVSESITNMHVCSNMPLVLFLVSCSQKQQRHFQKIAILGRMPALLVGEKKSITGNLVFQTTLFSSYLPVDYIRDAKYLLSLILRNLLNCIFSMLFPIRQQWANRDTSSSSPQSCSWKGGVSDQGHR